MSRVAFLARVLVAAGCRTLILTNAAGGVDPTLTPGEIVILRDHLMFSCQYRRCADPTTTTSDRAFPT